MVRQCAAGGEVETGDLLARWSQVPVQEPSGCVALGDASFARRAVDARLGFSADLSGCMTCGACSSVCPVTADRSVFDPVVLFRMVNLGLIDELLGSASVWLCLGCQRCTRVCTQRVPGHLVIRSLQALAMERGLAPPDMRERVRAVHRALFPQLVRRVGEVLGEGG
jgi:heterodisulfide reductase subunit C